MDRNSPAWSPITGKAYTSNKPRIETGFIPVFKPKPKIYYNFPEPTPFMGYDATHPLTPAPTGKYLTGAGGRMEEFEANFPEFTKLLLGNSTGSVTFVKPVYAYRLTQTGAGNPLTTKHCVISCGIHGNEHGGTDGAFKAMEVIARSPDFANFRAEYTLLFIPTCNPDGYYSYLRNLESIGPNGNTVNLNRNWDWFWPEYVESSSESKGAAPGSEIETQNILGYYATVVAAGGRFGALFDFHATESGVGSRYQSRDRIWREILYGPGDGGYVPDNYLTYYLDHYLWRIHRAVSTKRYLEYGGPDRFVRYQRSRFYPHFHSYFSSLGTFSVIAEEVKFQGAKNDSETVAQSCNYRLDYITSFCKAITLANWEFKDALLIEKETENILVNSDWSDWSVDEDGTQRPAYTGLARATSARTTALTGEKFFEDNGEAVELTSNIDVVLGDTSEYCALGYAPNPDTSKSGASAIVYPGNGIASGVLYYPYSNPSAYSAFALATHTGLFSTAVLGTPLGSKATGLQISNVFYALGGGTAALANAVADVTKLTFWNDSTLVEAAVIGSGFTARMAAGSCANTTPSEIYIVGGQNAAGAFLDTMGTFSYLTETWSVSTQVLTVPTRGCCCVHRAGYVYIFGGETGAGTVDTIYEWNLGTDTITDLTGLVSLPKPLKFSAAAYNEHEDIIYIYGGEESTGDMSNTFYSFDPDTYDLAEITIYQNLSDDEDVQEASEGFVPWSTKQGRWAAAYNQFDNVITLAGGRTVDGGGALVDGIYVHDPTDSTMNIARSSSWDYGYLRYGYVIQSGTQETGYVPGIDFVTHLADYVDPNGSWSIVGSDAQCSTGGILYLNLDTATVAGGDPFSSGRTDLIQMQEVAVRLSGAGTIATFSMFVRGDVDDISLDQPSGVTGVTIYEVSNNNYDAGGASARLRYTAVGSTLDFRSPGSLTYGIAVAVGAGGYFTLYANDTAKYIKVFVVVASLPVGNTTDTLNQVTDGSLESGYRLYYNHGATTWYLQRVSGSNVWNLASYTGSALNAVARRVKLLATGINPVVVRAWIDGTERLTVSDASTVRVTSDDGDTGIDACTGSANVLVSAFGVAQAPEKIFALEEFGDSTFDDFTDVMALWAISSTGGYGYPTGAGGPLLCSTTPDHYQHRVDCVYQKSGAGNIGHFSIAARATYVGAVIQRGYIATLDVTGGTFTVYRVVGSVQTSIGTWAHAFGTTEHKICLRVVGEGPVRINMWYSSSADYADYPAFEYYDFESTQITDTTGTCAISAAGDAANVYVRQLIAQSGAEMLDRFAHTMSVKSHATNVSGYTRVNVNPKDDTETKDSITRYVRDYYTLAPKISYWWYRLRTDLADGVGRRYYEDGLRAYQRVYKHAQKFYMDGMQLQRGSLLASSWQHPSVPRLAETFTFANVVNANSFRISFCWLPTCCFLDLKESDLEIFRVSVDANNYIRLYAKGYTGSRAVERNYFITGWMSGPHDPEFILEKVRGGAVVAQITVINYWNHNFRTGGSEREDCVIKFIVSHYAERALELSLDNYGSVGTERSFANLLPFTDYTGSVIYRGTGFFSPPDIEDTAQDSSGKVVPTQRRGLIERIRPNDRPALLVGDRDVTNGELVYQPYEVIAGTSFGVGDDFNRVDSSHLGSYWETHYPYFSSRADRTIGSGFDISGLRAVAYSDAVVYWRGGTTCYQVAHADLRVTCIVKLFGNGDWAGVFSRYDRSLWNSDYASWRGLTCYATHLQQIGVGAATLNIYRWHLGTAVLLTSAPIAWYATGLDHTLYLDLNGTTLTAGVSRGANSATVTVTDTNFLKSGLCGMLASTAFVASFGSFNLTANFVSEIE
jgi:hypothetical protein